MWCSRFSAPLHSKKWHLKVWLAGMLCWLKDFCPYLLSAFLWQTRGSKYHHQRTQQEVRSSSSSLFTGLVGFRTKLCYFQVSFFLLLEFTLSLSQDRCETAALEMSLASVKVRLEMFRKQACENSLVRLFPKRCLQSFELLLFVLSVAHSAATPALYEVILRSDQWWCSSKCCRQYVKKNQTCWHRNHASWVTSELLLSKF